MLAGSGVTDFQDQRCQPKETLCILKHVEEEGLNSVQSHDQKIITKCPARIRILLVHFLEMFLTLHQDIRDMEPSRKLGKCTPQSDGTNSSTCKHKTKHWPGHRPWKTFDLWVPYSVRVRVWGRLLYCSLEVVTMWFYSCSLIEMRHLKPPPPPSLFFLSISALTSPSPTLWRF